VWPPGTSDGAVGEAGDSPFYRTVLAEQVPDETKRIIAPPLIARDALAVLDVPKDQERGNDTHGSKIVVIPFDGAALDRDLQNAANATHPATSPAQPK
jgi:hypothetical protein